MKISDDENKTIAKDDLKKFSTFMINDSLYGIDVMSVQEVTKAANMTRVPLAQNFVRGLINLRGQIATAISLKDLFKIEKGESKESMNVVCNINGLLLSFLVDQIEDVIEIEEESFEPPLDTIPDSVKKFMTGVYKIPGRLLIVVDVNKISKELLKKS